MSIALAKQSILRDLENLATTKEKALTDIDGVITRCQEEIGSAAKEGDLAENAAYASAIENLEAATNDKKNLHNWVRTWELFSKNLNTDTLPSSRIDVGTTVRLSNINGRYTFLLVPKGLGNSRIGALAVDSPVGSKLINKTTGDTITVLVDTGTITYNVEEII